MSDANEGANPEPLGSGPELELDFLRGLIQAVDQSGIHSLDVAGGGTRIRISKTPPTAAIAAPAAAPPAPAPSALLPPTPEPSALPAPAAAPPANNWVEIKSPMVGTFYRSPSPDAPSYVEMGTRVSKGQTLCILEAMKLMNELEAEIAGVVREVCVDNAEPVEYGQVLFRVEPEA